MRRDGKDRAQGIGEVRDRHDPGARRDQLLERHEVDLAGVGDRRDTERRSLLLAQELPGDDVGVVLETRDQNLVARADVVATVGLRDQVGRLGRAAHEDDLVRLSRVEEPPGLLPGGVVGVGCVDRHVVHAAVDVGVALFVDVALGLDHGPRLLGRGGVVEVDQGLAVDRLRKDREVAADRLDVVGGGRLAQHRAHAITAASGATSLRPSSVSTVRRTEGMRMRSATSAAKA